MTLYNSTSNIYGPGWQICLRPYCLVGFSWTHEPILGGHIGLHLGPLLILYCWPPMDISKANELLRL